MQSISCITTFLRSMNATCESNENGSFLAQMRHAKLMSGREIFLENTEVFEERKHTAFVAFTKTYLCAKVGPI